MKLCATGRRVSAHVIRLVQAVQVRTATGAQSAHSGVRRSSSTLGTALAFSLLPLAHQASFMCRETAKPIAAAVDTESSVGGLRGRLLLPPGRVFPRLPAIAIQRPQRRDAPLRDYDEPRSYFFVALRLAQDWRGRQTK